MLNTSLSQPTRGFSQQEFETRTQRAQVMMFESGIDAMLLTTEPHVRYFSGFHSQFWLSPTRPWYLVIPLQGKPIAVIPAIGAVGMSSTWIEDIRTWSSPQPEDDGITLLADTIQQLPKRFGTLAMTLGPESYLRMPANDFDTLKSIIEPHSVVDCSRLLHQLCSIKSDSEIEKIRCACEITSDSFNALPEFAQVGYSERQVVQSMRLDLLQRGIDQTPFIVSASGQHGYDNIIMGPTDRLLIDGDILIIDTGSTYDGYYCDFDRNFAFSYASDLSKKTYDTLFEATTAGFAAAKPGVTTAELWKVMWSILEAGGARGNDVGRMGHGLGAQLTEWPSIKADDETVLKAGMVITLEPGMNYAEGKQMVHEENIVITETGAEMLSKRAAAELPVIEP